MKCNFARPFRQSIWQIFCTALQKAVSPLPITGIKEQQHGNAPSPFSHSSPQPLLGQMKNWWCFFAQDFLVSTKEQESSKGWGEGVGISCRSSLHIQTPGTVSLASLHFVNPSMRGKHIYKEEPCFPEGCFVCLFVFILWEPYREDSGW